MSNTDKVEGGEVYKMRKVGVGVIGTGFVAPAHIEAVRRLGCAEVIAISGRNLEKTKRVAREWGIEKYYENYLDLINDPQIEIVHNCTPNYLHYQINRQIIKSGKHVISQSDEFLDSPRNLLYHVTAYEESRDDDN